MSTHSAHGVREPRKLLEAALTARDLKMHPEKLETLLFVILEFRKKVLKNTSVEYITLAWPGGGGLPLHTHPPYFLLILKACCPARGQRSVKTETHHVRLACGSGPAYLLPVLLQEAEEESGGLSL